MIDWMIKRCLKLKQNTMNVLLCFIIFLVFSVSLTYGQQQRFTDSLYTELNKTKEDSAKIKLMLRIAKEYVYSDITKSQNLAEKSLDLATKNNLDEAKAKAHDFIGIVHTIKGDYLEGVNHFNSAITIFKKINQQGSLAKSYGNLAAAYQFLEDFEESLKVQLYSLNISEKLKDSVAMSVSYVTLGNIHHKLENFDRAAKYYKKSYKIAKQIHDLDRVVVSLCNLSLILIEQEKIDSAIYYITQSIDIAKKENLNFLMFQSIEVLGSIHLKNNNYQLAKQFFLQSKPEFEKSNYEYYMISNYTYLGRAYAGLQQKDSALYYYRKALTIGLKNDYKIHIFDIYEGLTKLYMHSGEKDSALYYFDKSITIKDELAVSEKTKITERFQAEYEAKKKEEEIVLLQEQNKVKDAIIEKRTYFIATLLLTVILFFTGSFFIRRQIKLKQQKIAVELEHRALRAQMNPHFLFNSLNSIQRMYVEGNENDANEYMADFSELMRKILDNSGQSAISLNEELTALKLYLNLEQLRCQNQISYSFHVDENIDVYHTLVPPLIIQPFVENAIWHGIFPGNKKGHISITLSLEKELIKCEIHDDGVGFSPQSASQHESKGIKITEQRIGNKIRIKTSPNEGTTVSFYINI
ncbi:MAG: tetratricopeptide repeat protein [Crocinitomicaceae bacterium]|nr:tetratricopeptide repeat protein [Crocinitomicaceae bacterium]